MEKNEILEVVESVEPGVVLDLFDDNIQRLEVFGIVERNNFKLVREYLSDDYQKEEEEKIFPVSFYDYDKDSEDFIKANINEIEKDIRNKKASLSSDLYNDLLNKVNRLKVVYYDLETSRKAYAKSSRRKIRKMLDSIEDLAYYLIIELRASLGLSVKNMEQDMIYDYCSAIAVDVNNNKYKRLSFEDHIQDGKFNLFK